MDEVTAFALGWSNAPTDMKQLGDIYTHLPFRTRTTYI